MPFVAEIRAARWSILRDGGRGVTFGSKPINAQHACIFVTSGTLPRGRHGEGSTARSEGAMSRARTGGRRLLSGQRRQLMTYGARPALAGGARSAAAVLQCALATSTTRAPRYTRRIRRREFDLQLELKRRLYRAGGFQRL